MASDSREEGSVAVELPADLEEWLDEQAATLGVEREQVLRQLVAAYRAADGLDGDVDPADLFDRDVADGIDIEDAIDVGEAVDVDAAIAEALEERPEELLAAPVAAAVERELADRLADEVEAAIEEHLPTVTDAVEGRIEDRATERIEDRSTERIEDRIDDLEAEFQEKIVDVRERVIQVKTETDAKATADHDHEEFERIDAIDERLQALAETVGDVEATVQKLREDVEEFEAEGGAAAGEEGEDGADGGDEFDAIEERLADAEDKLTRVAWVVSDLTDESGGRTTHEQAVARIKRAAAQEGVRTADCERCGESVDVALLTDPECPHCSAAVSDVRPTGGIFRTKATLVAAAQLESGEKR